MSDKIDKLDEGERLETGVEKQNIHYSNSKSNDNIMSPFVKTT